MAQWKATDVKTKAKILKEKIKNPDASIIDIEKKVNVNKDTVNKTIKEELKNLPSKSELIAKIIDNDKELLSIWTELSLDSFRHLSQKLKEKKETLLLNDIKTVNDILDKAKSRVALFGWDVTNSEWWLKLEAQEQELLNNLLD